MFKKFFPLFLFLGFVLTHNNSVYSETWQLSQKKLTLSSAELGVLDKITGRVTKIRMNVDEMKRFQNLEIELKKCQINPPEKRPENAAFLVVHEYNVERIRQKLFQGWMFSSSPSVSAIDHPVYDVWVISCFGNKGVELDKASSTEEKLSSVPTSN